MAYIGPVRRWDLFWADLEPVVGHEQRGAARPVLVISNDGYNAAFRMATVIPATKLETKRRAPYTFEVALPRGAVTDKHATLLMPNQVRSISTIRLLDKIGVLKNPEAQRDVEDRLLEHLGIAFEAEGVDG